MLEVISVILEAIGVLQNITKRQSTEDRLADFRSALDMISKVHDFLAEAKSFHDEFEKASKISVAPLEAAFKRYIDSSERLREQIQNYLSSEQTIVTRRSLHYKVIETGQIFTQSLPILENAKLISISYKELGNALLSYQQSLDKLKNLLEEGNFGRQMELTIRHLSDQNQRIVLVADNIILNTVPVLKFMHYETRRSLEGII